MKNAVEIVLKACNQLVDRAESSVPCLHISDALTAFCRGSEYLSLCIGDTYHGILETAKHGILLSMFRAAPILDFSGSDAVECRELLKHWSDFIEWKILPFTSCLSVLRQLKKSVQFLSEHALEKKLFEQLPPTMKFEEKWTVMKAWMSIVLEYQENAGKHRMQNKICDNEKVRTSVRMSRCRLHL